MQAPHNKQLLSNNQHLTMIFVRRHPTLFNPFLFEPDIDRYINVFSDDDNNTSKTPARGQNVNVTEGEDAWTIYMDVPGVKSENVEIDGSNDALAVRAVRKHGDEVTAAYQQTFNLNPRNTNFDAVSADLSDGVLTITVPKKTPPAPTTVAITTADAPEAPEDKTKEFRYTLELPGVKADKVKVEFRDDMLHLEAERKKGNFSSTIERSMTVGPTVDTANARAYLMDGILSVVAPRVEVVKKPEARKITLGATTPAIEQEKKDNKSK